MSLQSIAEDLAHNPIKQYFTGPAAPYVYAPDRLPLSEVGPFRYESRFCTKPTWMEGAEISPVMEWATTYGFEWSDNPEYVEAGFPHAPKFTPIERECCVCHLKFLARFAAQTECNDCIPF